MKEYRKVAFSLVLIPLILVPFMAINQWAEASGNETLQSIVSASFGLIIIWILANGLIRIFEGLGIKFGKRKDGE